MTTKKTLGRQRIEIKKLEKKSNKQVTFSKRRTGLFKKAGELSVLCGAEVAVIVFSPNDKVFCFGHPTVDAVIHRFSDGSSSSPEPAETSVPIAEFNGQYNHLVKVLEMEKNKLIEIKASVNNARINGVFWWDERVEAMGLEDLQQYRTALMELRRKVRERTPRVRGDMSLPLPLPPSLQTPGSLPGMESGMGNQSGGTEDVGGEECFEFGYF